MHYKNEKQIISVHKSTRKGNAPLCPGTHMAPPLLSMQHAHLCALPLLQLLLGGPLLGLLAAAALRLLGPRHGRRGWRRQRGLRLLLSAAPAAAGLHHPGSKMAAEAEGMRRRQE